MQRETIHHYGNIYYVIKEYINENKIYLDISNYSPEDLFIEAYDMALFVRLKATKAHLTSISSSYNPRQASAKVEGTNLVISVPKPDRNPTIIPINL